MLRISQLKLRTGHTEKELRNKVLRILQISENSLRGLQIRKQSLDARRRPELYYVYTVDICVENEAAVLKKCGKKKRKEDVSLCRETAYQFPDSGNEELKKRPVIVGLGPAGIFCAYFLAAAGYRPVVIERGAPVEERQADVETFWKTGRLDTRSNVQFGEGGAGTFSDGKLNTLVKDPAGRIRKILEIFHEHGAPEDILYVNKPHIGTDILCQVIRSMRQQIIAWGGEVRFHTRMTELLLDGDGSRITGVRLEEGGEMEELETDILVLAPGHSARDTFARLYEQQVPMEAKAFAVGVRTEHPQSLINLSQYGTEHPQNLSAAAYKLTAKLPDGRGVYSFCMCPGGYVVNASSEEGMLAVNGMSFHARDGRNANSAIVVTVNKEDFGSEHPLAGIEFQRKLESAAAIAGDGKVPVQRYGDFYESLTGEAKRSDYSSDIEKLFEGHRPCIKGNYVFSDIRAVFPEKIGQALVQGIEKFDAKIRGFSHPDVLLSAVESRTSSPVRILRGETLESRIGGLYPCGEGAGYAGGITSAAVDGLKIAEAVRGKYAPFDKTEEGLRKI